MYLDITLEEEQKLDKLVENCDLSISEALEVIYADREVDNTGDTAGNIGTLTKEQEKTIKQYKNDAEKIRGKQTKRKPNDDKRFLISLLAEVFNNQGIDCTVDHPERIILINYNNTEYKVTLGKVTKKKEG